MTALLDVKDLSAFYRKAEAIRSINLAVGPGQIVTVIGPNGAGKSSLLLALMGALLARGAVSFDGRPIATLPLESRVALGMALVPEGRALFKQMSVADNLALGAFGRRHDTRGERAARLGEIYNLFPHLRERSGQLADTLSGGERQMLAVGRALLGRPRLLMLDEPSLGLAPRVAEDVFRMVGRLRNQGVSILLVEQNARAALQIADYGYVLEHGAIVAQGKARELASDRRVIDIYLGTTD